MRILAALFPWLCAHQWEPHGPARQVEGTWPADGHVFTRHVLRCSKCGDMKKVDV